MAEPDPLAVRSPALLGLFGWYLRFLFWRRFRAVRLSRAGLPQGVDGRPVIVFSNHPSWWDPALFILLGQACFPGRPGYGPMEAASLARYGVLRRMGVFGIEPGRRGAARFLRLGLRILSDRRAMLWVTAGGAFADPRPRPVRLRPGIAHLARLVPDAVLLPLAIEYPFWNESRPEALARFGAPLAAGGHRSVAEWRGVLELALGSTMDALAAESAARDPALFIGLQRGRAGTGTLYDGWRAAAAWARLRRFDASHGGAE